MCIAQRLYVCVVRVCQQSNWLGMRQWKSQQWEWHRTNRLLLRSLPQLWVTPYSVLRNRRRLCCQGKCKHKVLLKIDGP